MLEIRLLGTMHLRYGDETVRLESAKLQALTAYLLVFRGRPLSRQQLAGIFWPDSPEPQARTNLRNLLHRLRHVLPEADSFLEVGGETLRWREEAPFQLDVAVLEELCARPPTASSLEAAIALYAGDLLPGCYDDWIEPERQRLRRTLLSFLERGMGKLTERGELAQAVACAEATLRLEPLQEELYARLMRLHAEAGDRARALEVYGRCVQTLRRELDLEPGPTIGELYRQLVRADSTMGLEEPPPAGSRLVGRERAWRRFQEAWQTAEAGRPRIVVLTGEAGIGKTRFAEELLAWAGRQGFSTARARCYEVEGEMPYAVAIDLLRSVPPTSLSPALRRRLADLLPPRYERRAPPAGAASPLERYQLFEALTRAMQSRLPLLLFIDDAHWCDRDSLEWLHFLLRTPMSGALTALLAVRAEEAAESLRLAALLNDWRRAGCLEQIELERLGRAAVEAMARDLTGEPLSPQALDRLHAETEGNPLFIVEVVRAGPELEGGGQSPALSPTIHSLLEARLDGLSPDGRTLAGIASVFGRAFRTEVLADASELEAGRFADALDELLQRGVVREGEDGRCDFSHGKLAEVAYKRLSRTRRALYHRRVAHALEAAPTRELEALSGQIAFHFEQAGQLERAAEHYLHAGDAWRRACAFADAIELYTQALRLLSHLERPELRWAALRGRENARDILADRAGQLEDLTALEQLARQQNDPTWLVEVYNRRSQHAYRIGDSAKAVQFADTACELALKAGAVPLEAIAWRNCGLARLQLNGDDKAALAALLRAIELARAADETRLACEVQGELASGYLRLGRIEEAAAANEAALSSARMLGDRREEGLALGRAARASFEQRQYTPAITLARQAREIARELCDRSRESRELGLIGLACCHLHHFDDAVAQLQEALTLSREVREPYNESLWLHFLGMCRHGMGQSRIAATPLEQALAIARTLDHPFLEAYHLARRARIAAESGMPEAADGYARQGWERSRSLGNLLLDADLLYAEGQACYARGHLPEAGERLTRSRELYRQCNERNGELEASIGLAEVLVVREAWEEAQAVLEPVLSSLDRCPDGVLFPQRAWLASARILTAVGRIDEASAAGAKGRSFIESVAARLRDPEERRAFLEGIGANRVLLAGFS